MGVIEAWKKRRFNWKRTNHLRTRQAAENEFKRIDAILLCQRAIGGHKFATATGMADKELMDAIPKQVNWLKAKLQRLAVLEMVLAMHPRLAHQIELWAEDLQRMPTTEKVSLDKRPGK